MAEKSSFLSLPPELRLLIYEKLAGEKAMFTLTWSFPEYMTESLVPFTYLHRPTGRRTAILRTSKTSHAEAAPVFAKRQVLRILFYIQRPKTTCRIGKDLLDQCAAAMRRVRIPITYSEVMLSIQLEGPNPEIMLFAETLEEHFYRSLWHHLKLVCEVHGVRDVKLLLLTLGAFENEDEVALYFKHFRSTTGLRSIQRISVDLCTKNGGKIFDPKTDLFKLLQDPDAQKA